MTEDITHTSDQPSELRKEIAKIINQAKAVKINSGEGWDGFTYMTDGKQDIDKLMALFTAHYEAEIARRVLEVVHGLSNDDIVSFDLGDGDRQYMKVERIQKLEAELKASQERTTK